MTCFISTTTSFSTTISSLSLNPKLELPTNNIPPGEPSAPNKNHYGVQGRTRRQLALRTCDPCHFVDLTLVIVSKACRGAAVTGNLNTVISVNRSRIWASVPVETGYISSGLKKRILKGQWGLWGKRRSKTNKDIRDCFIKYRFKSVTLPHSTTKSHTNKSH